MAYLRSIAKASSAICCRQVYFKARCLSSALAGASRRTRLVILPLMQRLPQFSSWNLCRLLPTQPGGAVQLPGETGPVEGPER